MSFAPDRRPSVARHLGSLLLAASTAIALAGLAVVPASAAAVCDPAGDACVVVPDTVQTPLGVVSVTVGDGNVVTVRLDPIAPNTLVVGTAFAFPPGPWCRLGYLGGCGRTTIDTIGGLVTIDTYQYPPGPPGRGALPSLAVISIHPPNPCRARTTGTTVVFTPIYPPGPPA